MNRPILRILVIDDDEDDFFITKELFDEIPVNNLKIEWASTIEKGLKSYERGDHDIYFVDYLLGAQTGIDFLIAAKKTGQKNPVIMITGKGDEKVDKQAMAYGAADYLIKSELDAEKLERCVRYVLDRFTASQKLAESEAKYRSIFEKSRDMIFIANAQGKFIDSNESVMRVLGYSRQEILRKSLTDVIDDTDGMPEIVNFILQQQEVVDYECMFTARNGQKKICLISTLAQLDSDNNPIIQGVIHDITKRRKAENDLATAEKLAVTGRVVRMIGHEIRNPLTNINLALEQLQTETGSRKDLNMYFDIITRNSERINSLITELLNSSKPAQLNIRKGSINKIVSDTLEQMRDRFVLRGVEVITNFSDDLCDISTDEEKIKIALLNIFVNAVEAMEQGKGRLEVSTRTEDDWCIIESKDNGSGIPPDKINRIFDPFFSGKPKGTGLGLSTTHNIISSHQGIIDVSSVSGKGTSFIIKLKIK